jgi:hypothetical protein
MTAADETIERVVPLHPLSEAQALDWLRAQPGGRITASAAELGRRWGWHRQRALRHLKAWAKTGHIKRRGGTVTVVGTEGGTSPGSTTGTNRRTRTVTSPAYAPVTPLGEPGAFVTAPRLDRHALLERAGWWSTFLAGLAFLLGLAATAVGLYVNASFLWKFGRSSEASLLLAIIGLVTDGMTVTLPSVAVGLWLRRRYALVATAAPIYLLAVTMNKFIPTSAAMVGAAQRAHDQECAKFGPICRQRADALNAAIANKTLTDHAADLDRRISAAIEKLAGIPVLAAGDPQVEAAVAVVTWASMGTFKPSASDVEMLRVLGVAAIPIVGGLLLSFAFGLAQPARVVSRIAEH